MFTQAPLAAEEIRIQQMDPLFIAERLKKWDPDIDPTKVKLLSFQPVTWNDGSLGCALPGHNYTQALVPGYLIWFEYGNILIEVHTDRSMMTLAMPGIGFL
jgi:hypothetical protein